MAKIMELYDRMNGIDIKESLKYAIQVTVPDIKLLQQNQMLLGQSALDANQRIGTYKNPLYAAKKAAMNSLANGTVDLYLTGDFQENIFVEVQDDNTINFGSNTDQQKVSSLFDKYGDSFFGLNPSTAIEYVENYLKPTFQYIINVHMKKI